MGQLGLDKGAGEVTLQYLGSEVLIYSAGSAALTVPTGAKLAEIQAHGSTWRLRYDGGLVGTASGGVLLTDNQIRMIPKASLASLRLQGQAAGSASVLYWG